MIDFQVAYDKLAQFETADEIADFFRSEGIKATPQKGSSCAISRWMSDTTGQKIYTSYFDVTLNGRVTNTGEGEWLSPRSWEAQINNTDAMTRFAKNFDDGHYPDLIDWEKEQ